MGQLNVWVQRLPKAVRWNKGLGDAFRGVTSIVNVVNTFRMLDIGLPESRNALILAGRIEDCFVQREWLSDPLRESGVVSDIILREGVDKNG
jgi:hypothetical protein